MVGSSGFWVVHLAWEVEKMLIDVKLRLQCQQKLFLGMMYHHVEYLCHL